MRSKFTVVGPTSVDGVDESETEPGSVGGGLTILRPAAERREAKALGVPVEDPLATMSATSANKQPTARLPSLSAVIGVVFAVEFGVVFAVGSAEDVAVMSGNFEKGTGGPSTVVAWHHVTFDVPQEGKG